jgi:hypothetical protein
MSGFVGLATASVVKLSAQPDPLNLTWLFNFVALFVAGGAVYVWHGHNAHQPNAAYNNIARYMRGTPETRQSVLRTFAANPRPSTANGVAPTLTTREKEAINEALIVANPRTAFLTAAARWQDAWDKLTRCQQALSGAAETWKKYRNSSRLMIMDITRPTENATDDELIAAGEEYVSHLADLANGVGFSRSGSASTKAIKTMVEEFRTGMVQHQFATNRNFSLNELLEALKTALAKLNLVIDSTKGEQLNAVPTVIREAATTIVDNLGIKKQKEVELAHAVRASKSVKEDLDKIHAATGIPKNQYPGAELTKLVPVVLSLAGSRDVANPPKSLQDAIDRFKVLFNDMNQRLPQGFATTENVTATTLAKNMTNIGQMVNVIIGEMPVKTSANWKVVNKLLTIRLNLVKKLESTFAVDITETTAAEDLLKQLKNQQGKIEDLETRLANANAKLAAETTHVTPETKHPSDTAPYWQAVAKNSGAPANVYRAVDDKGSAERGLFGLITKLHATIDSLKQNPMVGGEDSNAWSCELKCKLTQFDGECQLVLAWEAQVQQEALTIWNESKTGFQEYARVVFLGALCKYASEWARYTDLETPTAGTETFGEALQALIDLLKKHFGVDMAEEKRKAEEIFDCQPIHADCWGNFWLQFVGQAGRAGYKDELQSKTSTLIKNRILRKLPAKDMNRLKMVALNRADAAGMPSDPWQLSQSDLQNLLARTWKKEQEVPTGQACTRLVCKSGLPPEKCPCKKQVNFADTPQEPDPRCRNHTPLSSQQKGVVFSNLKGLPKKNDDSGTSPSFRACQKMNVCARCNGKFNTAKFDEWWSNGQKM